MTPKQAYTYITKLLRSEDSETNILLRGMPGVAKTAIIEQAAADTGYETVFVHGVTSDPIDAKGLPAIVQDGMTMATTAEFLPFGDMRRIIEATKPLLVVLDDLGQAPKAVQAAWMQPIHGRRLNGFEIPKCVRFIAATNRKEDRAGATDLITPLRSRLNFCVTVEPDLKSWCEYSLTDQTIDPTVISFARFVHQDGDEVFRFKPGADDAPSVPRTLTALGRLHKTLGKDMMLEIAQGCIGEAMGTKFMAFLETYSKLPNPDKVLLNPDTAPVPDRPDVLFALTGVLANRASENNIDNLLVYEARLPREFGVSMVKDIHQRDQKLELGITDQPSMVQWMLKNSELLFD